MKIDKNMHFERLKVGYFEPPQNKLCCANCGASEKKGKRPGPSPYYCRRHGFFVRKDGVCPDQSSEAFKAKTDTYSQESLFQ